MSDLAWRGNCSVEEARDLTDRIKAGVETVWALLLEAHERGAWVALGYHTWNAYVEGEFRMSKQRSFQLLDQGRVIRAIEAAAESTDVDLSEAEARDLKQQLPRLVEDVRERVREVEPEQRPQIVRQTVEETRERLRQERQSILDDQRALMDRVNPPGFDAGENAEQARQRGEFRRLCRDLAAFPPPAQFIANHSGENGYGALEEAHVEAAREAHLWLSDFLERWDNR